MTQHSPRAHVNLLNEQSRLETFHNWPMTAALEPEKLAQAGFFYVGPQDRVRCIFCGGVLKSWQPADDPHVEHQRLFPHCPFVQGNDVGNIPIEVSESSEVSVPARTYQPCHPHYGTLATRLQTFCGWPARASQQPEGLSKAGFFYSGVDDCVRCFFCDGGLRNWSPIDDPWVAHARWFPRCRYLLEEKGSDFVASVLQRFPQTQHEERITPQWVQGPGQVGGAVETSIMESEAVQEALKMGFQPSLVQAAVQQLMAITGGQQPALVQLLDKLMQEQNVQSTQGLEGSQVQPVPPNSAHETRLNPLYEVKFDPSSERILCKICMDNQVQVTFLPCGHLICCSSCASNVHTCPVCRKIVRQTVRTYLC